MIKIEKVKTMEMIDHNNGHMEMGDYEAVRMYLKEGDSFSGWIVRSKTNRYDYSDPINTKEEAKEQLRLAQK